MLEEGEGSNPLQEPLAKEYKECIVWRGHHVHTPNWWRELVRILGINDFQEFTQKIRASFEVPWAKSKVQDVKNNYLALPAPKCICWKEFLPPQDPMFPCQDFREEQAQKTLAYVWALQYWVEKTNLPMPGQPQVWQGVSKNWSRWWNLMWPSWMMPYWRGQHLRRSSKKDKPAHPAQRRPCQLPSSRS